MTIETKFDPRKLQPGTKVRYDDGKQRSMHTLNHRKDDDTGWWLTDGGGLADKVLTGEWDAEGRFTVAECPHGLPSLEMCNACCYAVTDWPEGAGRGEV